MSVFRSTEERRLEFLIEPKSCLWTDFADPLGDGGTQGFADGRDRDPVKDFLEKASHDHLNGFFPS